MKKQKVKPTIPRRKIGEGDYTEDRKAWAAAATMEDFEEFCEKHSLEMLAELAAIQAAKRRKKKSA
ncbi:MAG: hypothetical protein IT462_03335 [Planctomycetes bacterium]|nr:hypothetical protein [Planctomycetota bacterium]